MADTKITALTALTGADPANDVIPIVDVSDTTMAASGTTKKISVNNILGASGTATLASATITGAASAAGLSVTGSTIPTNGVYLPSANNLGFAYNSTLGMTLNSTGLGVGGSPVNKMTVTVAPGTTTSDGLRVTDSTRSIGVYQTGSAYSYLGIGANQNLIYTNGSRLDIVADGQSLFLRTQTNNYLNLDTSGNVGIGVTPSAWGNAYKVVQTGQALGVYSRANLGYYGTKFNLYNDNTNDVAITTNYVGEYRFELLNGNHVWLNKSSAGTAGVNQTLTQAMTLDASGNLLVGTTDTSSTSGAGFKIIGSGLGPYVVNAASTNAALAYTMYSTGAAAYRFYVGWGGTVFATNTTISAISDARLKENVQDIDVGLGAILALKPRKFDWKAGKGKDIKGDRGFIAQEFEQVFPQLVDEWKDAAPEGEAPYKSVRQDLIPVLVKAIQELAAEVNALKNA